MNKITSKHLIFVFLIFIVFFSFGFLIFPSSLNLNKKDLSNLKPIYKDNSLLKSGDKHVLRSKNHDLFISLNGKISKIENDKITISFFLPLPYYNEVKDLENIKIFINSKEIHAEISKIGDEVFDNNVLIETFFYDNTNFFILNMFISANFFIKTLYNVFIVPKKFIYNESGYSYAYKKFPDRIDTIFIKIIYDLKENEKYIITGDFFEYDVLLEKN